MEYKFVEAILALQRVNKTLKTLSEELDKLDSIITDDDFLSLVDTRIDTISKEDYD